jgi:molecular chaperone GrpE
VTDPRRQEHDPDSTAPGRDPAPGPDPSRSSDPSSASEPSPAPDALGAWPEGDAERAAMPDQRAADEAAAADDHDAEAPATAEDDPRSREELLLALREAEAQRDEYLDGVRRARAEFENYRKRTMREGASQRENGRAEVAEGLLEVLDDLDRTLEAATASEDAGLARGVELVAEKLVASLRAAGLERVDATGVAFDPNRHEAVQQSASDEPKEEPVVATVLRPGYALGDKVLRAAMVVVEQ